MADWETKADNLASADAPAPAPLRKRMYYPFTVSNFSSYPFSGISIFTYPAFGDSKAIAFFYYYPFFRVVSLFS